MLRRNRAVSASGGEAAGVRLSPGHARQGTHTAPTRQRPPRLERAMGIEPTLSAWKAEVLPLNYARKVSAGALHRSAWPECAPPGASLGSGPDASAARAAAKAEEWWGEADSNRRR